MRLKPKSTVQNVRALHYKRYTAIEDSVRFNTVYYIANAYPYKYFLFDSANLDFVGIEEKELPENPKIYTIGQDGGEKLKYKDWVFQYNGNKFKKYDLGAFNYIGDFGKGTEFPDYKDLNQFVFINTFPNRQPKYGDYVNFINVNGDSEFKYKIIYLNDIWEFEPDIPLKTKQISNSSIGKYQLNRYYYVGNFDFMIKGSEEGTTTQFIKGNILPLQSFSIKYFDDSADLKEDDLVVADGRLFAVEDVQATQKRLPKPYYVYFATLNNIL